MTQFVPLYIHSVVQLVCFLIWPLCSPWVWCMDICNSTLFTQALGVLLMLERSALRAELKEQEFRFYTGWDIAHAYRVLKQPWKKDPFLPRRMKHGRQHRSFFFFAWLFMTVFSRILLSAEDFTIFNAIFPDFFPIETVSNPSWIMPHAWRWHLWLAEGSKTGEGFGAWIWAFYRSKSKRVVITLSPRVIRSWRLVSSWITVLRSSWTVMKSIPKFNRTSWCV